MGVSIPASRPVFPFSLSGYTTTFDCIKMGYPLELSLRSLLYFCDEVIVVDTGSTDNTLELLQKLAKSDSRLHLYQEKTDFSNPRWAVQNCGEMKARARSYCRADYCWQMDVDEIVDKNEVSKMIVLPKLMGNVPVLMLPLIEFWGSLRTIRADFLSFKLRFSRNDPSITHGIPKSLIMHDSAGRVYPRPFESDCCNYINKNSLEPIPSSMPFPKEFMNIRGSADPRFQKFFTRSIQLFPSVLHLSWLDIPRKIRQYKNYWHRHHKSEYNLSDEDSALNNVMFEKPWNEVTEEDIQRKSSELLTIGPRSFHTKINPLKRGATMPYNLPVPIEIVDWVESQKFLGNLI